MFFLSFPRSAPVRKPRKKSFLFCAQGRWNTKTFQFFQKSLHLPLYKIEISGIIIIVRCASVAQSVEQGTENPRVIGSIPIGGTTSKILSFIGKSCKQDFCDEHQIFSFSPQNFASQIFAGTPLEIRVGGCRDKCTGYAAVAHLVERHLAKVEVASSSLVGRSIKEQQQLLRYGPVAQLVRAPACHAGGRRFEPDPGRSLECQSFVWQSYK